MYKRKYWSATDIEFLTNNAKKMSINDLATYFNVSYNFIVHKPNKLGIQKSLSVIFGLAMKMR